MNLEVKSIKLKGPVGDRSFDFEEIRTINAHNRILFLSDNIENTLLKSSNIWFLKSKFFLYRALTYFGILLIPIWLPKTLHLNTVLQIIMLVFYTLFMCSQWFMLGKEVDHRLKIYFRVNSSIDRVVYRLFLGMIFFILLFNTISFLPHKWIYNSYWVIWAVLGLFYSWPTRGKIIKESVTTNFNEFKYLDSFEKTLVFLSLLMFVFSIPELPKLTNIEALKLFFDPFEKIGNQYWNFLLVGYYPFFKYPILFKLAWCIHFYLVGLGLFCLTFYAMLRFFVSRRLSLLGVFAVLSSWSFTKILASNYGDAITTTYSLLWVWTLLWVVKSATYRAGLFLGLVSYLGTIINQSFALLVIPQCILLYLLFLRDKTLWYKRQILKYSLFGLSLTAVVLFSNIDILQNMIPIDENYFAEFTKILNRKAFYSLSYFGFLILLFKAFDSKVTVIRELKVNKENVIEIFIIIFILFLSSLVLDSYLVKSFSLMWMFVFFSLIPLELVFQSISRLRSSRNMIYLIYILICLLDSHFEGRVKIFLRLFN